MTTGRHQAMQKTINELQSAEIKFTRSTCWLFGVTCMTDAIGGLLGYYLLLDEHTFTNNVCLAIDFTACGTLLLATINSYLKTRNPKIKDILKPDDIIKYESRCANFGIIFNDHTEFSLMSVNQVIKRIQEVTQGDQLEISWFRNNVIDTLFPCFRVVDKLIDVEASQQRRPRERTPLI